MYHILRQIMRLSNDISNIKIDTRNRIVMKVNREFLKTIFFLILLTRNISLNNKVRDKETVSRISFIGQRFILFKI